jgi:hypothetical protein
MLAQPANAALRCHQKHRKAFNVAGGKRVTLRRAIIAPEAPVQTNNNISEAVDKAKVHVDGIMMQGATLLAV